MLSRSAKTTSRTVRTGRANPALFQKIMVEYYGTPTPLQQLASLQNPEARTLIVTPYDKTALKEIEKAIVAFPNLGATPEQRRQHHPRHDARAHRRAPQRVREDRPRQGRRGEGRRSATCAARPKTTSTPSAKRSAKTTSRAPRKNSTRSPRSHVDAHRRRAEAQRSRTARGLMPTAARAAREEAPPDPRRVRGARAGGPRRPRGACAGHACRHRGPCSGGASAVRRDAREDPGAHRPQPARRDRRSVSALGAVFLVSLIILKWLFIVFGGRPGRVHRRSNWPARCARPAATCRASPRRWSASRWCPLAFFFHVQGLWLATIGGVIAGHALPAGRAAFAPQSPHRRARGLAGSRGRRLHPGLRHVHRPASISS